MLFELNVTLFVNVSNRRGQTTHTVAQVDSDSFGQVFNWPLH